jgi:hypothetical protein
MAPWKDPYRGRTEAAINGRAFLFWPLKGENWVSLSSGDCGVKTTRVSCVFGSSVLVRSFCGLGRDDDRMFYFYSSTYLTSFVRLWLATYRYLHDVISGWRAAIVAKSYKNEPISRSLARSVICGVNPKHTIVM